MMKLYFWGTDLIAHAESVEQARELILKKVNYHRGIKQDLESEPRIIVGHHAHVIFRVGRGGHQVKLPQVTAETPEVSGCIP